MFEDIKANIAILEKQGYASVDQLLESMCKLFDGAGKSNRDVSDVVLYGRSLINLFDRISPSYHLVADKLSGLHNEDVEEVKCETKKISDRLKEIEPIIQQLVAEKDKHSEEMRKYNSAQERQKQLKNELESLPNVSVEEIEKENHRLENEIERRRSNQARLEQATSDADSAAKEAAKLETEMEEKRIEKENAEKEKQKLEKERSDYEAWKNTFEKDIKTIREQASEASAAYTVIQNAWNSLQTDTLLPEIIASTGDYSSFKSNISSFEDLQRWFESSGCEIKKTIEIYHNMYTAVLSVYNTATK